jgi:hypothetical protein
MLNVNGRLAGFKSAVLANIETPEAVATIAEVASGRGEFGHGRRGLLGHGVVARVSGPVVFGAARRERRKLRAVSARVRTVRDFYRQRAAALRARSHGVLSERWASELLFRGGPFCFCGRQSSWSGMCRAHGGNPAYEYAS